LDKPQTEGSAWHPLVDFRNERGWVTGVALALAVLFHLSVVMVLPEEFVLRPERGDGAEEEPVELTLVEPEAPSPDEMRFVEANPEAPENEPDRKNQYSFRSQQASDDRPDANELEAPAVEGEEPTRKIVQGAVEEPSPPEPGVYSEAARPGEGEGTDGGRPGEPNEPQAAQPQPLPAPDFIQQDPVDEEGPGSDPAREGEAMELTESVDPDAPIDVYRPPDRPPRPQTAQGSGGGNPDAKPVPRERPRLDPELIRGPLMNSRGAAANRGTLAIDATFSEFGEYQQQFYAALQVGWYQEIEFFQPIDTGAKVFVKFTLHKDGKISGVEVIESTAGDLATTICENAIVKRSPFRPWTKEMVEVFGEERTLRVVFHYR